jgi:hypothetical protein
MYAYFNQLSATGGSGGDVPVLLKTLDEVSAILKDVYGIERIKLPKGFKGEMISGSYSVSQLLSLPPDEFPTNQALSLIGFFANRTTEDHYDVEVEVERELENKNAWAAIYYQGEECYLLTGAYLLRRPVVSLATAGHCEDFLKSIFRLDYGVKHVDKNALLENIYNTENLRNHQGFLLGVKLTEQFRPNRWRPDDRPIWNDQTPALLEALHFPESLKGKKDNIIELLNVGKLVAELNSWEYHGRISSFNTNAGQIRSVFISVGGRGTWYLSIDIKNYGGTFELHDSQGRHEGQLSFTTGEFIPRGPNNIKGQYTDGTHNIKIRRGD